MKLILLSDPHLLFEKPKARTDDAVLVAWKKLSWVYATASEERATVLISGDLTDGPRSWQLIPLLTNFYQAVSEYDGGGERRGPPTYVVRGQHDTYMRNTEMNPRTMMGVLAEAGLLKELTGEPVMLGAEKGRRAVALYGVSWGENIDDPDLEWELDPEATNVLVIHAPITDQSLWEGQNYFHAERFLEDHKFDLILCGDIHRTFAQRVDDRWICNTGPMIRKDADLYNFIHKPCVFMYDTTERTLDMLIIPHKPAQDVLNRAHIEKEQVRIQSTMDMEHFIEKIKAARGENYKASAFEDNLRLLLRTGEARSSVVSMLEEVTKCQLKEQPEQTSTRIKI